MTPEKEKEVREKLNSELKDGFYTIGDDSMKTFMGKQGFIDFQISLMKEAENYKPKSNKEYSDKMQNYLKQRNERTNKRIKS
jgi:hypothetical protein